MCAQKKFSYLDLVNSCTRGKAESVITEYTEIWLNPKTVKEAPNNTHKEYRDIKQLADSFLLVGQEQPTVLARINGEYWIIDGHRRNLANIYNLERGYDQFKKVRYYYKDMTETMYELSLLAGNGYTQELTDYEKTELAERLKAALRKARDLGEIELKGNIRDIVQSILGESSGQMARMGKIETSLIEEGKEQFKKGTIGMTAAYETARLPPEEQKEVVKSLAAGEMQAKDLTSMIAERKKEKKCQKDQDKQIKKEELTGQANRSSDKADQSVWPGMNPPVLSDSDTSEPEEIEREAVFTLQELLIQANKITFNELLVLQDILMKCNNR